MPAEVAKQLGLSGERLARSKMGFESEQVGIGHYRLKEKAMLTHPGLISERRAIKTKALVESGQELPEEGVRVPETPSDKATAMYRHLLWQVLTTIWESNGNARITDYQGSPRSSELHRLPFSEAQFNRRGFVEWLLKQPGWKSGLGLLEKVAIQCNPQAFDSHKMAMSKAEIGMWRIDTDTIRDAKNAADGALAQVCEMMAEAAAHFAALERQEKLGKKRQN